MRGRLDKMVPPEPHSQDLPHRSVLRAGFRLIPGEQILDIKAHERVPAVHQGHCLYLWAWPTSEVR